MKIRALLLSCLLVTSCSQESSSKPSSAVNASGAPAHETAEPAAAQASEAPTSRPAEPEAQEPEAEAQAEKAAAEPPAEPTADLETAAKLAHMKERAKEIWNREPRILDEIEVQHVLIAYAGAPRIENVTRTKEQAAELAADILSRVEAGEDFSQFFHLSSDSNSNRTLKASEPGSVVGGFWHIAWRLDVGEYGVMPYHGDESPYGWHVIKRVR